MTVHQTTTTTSPQLLPAGMPVHRMVIDQAKRTPHAEAVVDGDQVLTYAELDARSAELAARLSSAGVDAGALVGICLPRNSSVVVAMLAVLRAGAAYVPLDPAYPAERLEFTLADAQAALVIADPGSAGVLQGIATRTMDPCGSTVDSPVAHAEPEVDVDDLAYVLHTSGSTGRPNGVAVTHRGVNAMLRWAELTYGPADRAGVLFSTSICFDISVFEVFFPLAVGGTVVLAPNATALPDLAARDRVTLVNTVPSAMAALLRGPGLPESVRVVNLAGEALPRRLADQVYQQPQVQRLYNLYGPTEDTVYSTWALVPRDDDADPPIGVPLSGTTAQIVDEDGRPVPDGERGELWLSGEGLARGYLHRPELTAERFVTDSAGRRAYRTRDVVSRRPDNALAYHGRVDHQVKIRGFRIELGEIEAHLAERSDITDVAVTAWEDERGDKALAAYVVPHSRSAEARWVESWQLLYESDEDGPRTAALGEDFSDWRNSYDGAPIPIEQMRDWRDQVHERIRALRPKRVLEIGVGTGLVLAGVAPHCEQYWGTDISAAAIERLEAQVRADPDLAGKVTLRTAAADELDSLPTGVFDTVVINSVIAYFPSEDYLRRVLRGVLDLLAPGGTVFIGDVRNLRLAREFQAGVAARKLSADGVDPAALDPATVSRLRAMIRLGLAEEAELLVDPAYFAGLDDRVSGVDVRLKHGHRDNELFNYRYDVVLHTGTELVHLERAHTVRWGSDVRTLAEVATQVGAHDMVRVTGVPNQRVRGDAALVRAVDGRPEAGRLPAPASADFHDLADRLGRSAATTWHSTEADTVDVVFWGPGRQLPSGLQGPEPQRSGVPLTNVPAGQTAVAGLATTLRSYLLQRLPAHMVPAEFIVLDALPLTPNGKLDRSALPAPRRTRQDLAVPFARPEGELEQAIAETWRKILRLDRVGALDHFFELGGNSLLLLDVRGALAAQLGVDLQPTAMFASPTVRSLAAHVDELRHGRAGTTAHTPARTSSRANRAATHRDARRRSRDSAKENS